MEKRMERSLAGKGHLERHGAGRATWYSLA